MKAKGRSRRIVDISTDMGCIAAHGGSHGDAQLGHRGAEGDDGESDDKFRHVELACDAYRALGKIVCTAEHNPYAYQYE